MRGLWQTYVKKSQNAQIMSHVRLVEYMEIKKVCIGNAHLLFGWFYDVGQKESANSLLFKGIFVIRKNQYKDVYRRTIEIPQSTHIFKANCCLNVHNVHLKLASPISG